MTDGLAVRGAHSAFPSESRDEVTRRLLLAGVAAGPLYVVVAAGQALTREGFDLRHHAVSLLSNGDLGWIQVANFLVAGLLVIAFAFGVRRVLRGERAGRWGPLLLGLYGAGMIGAGVFVADPANGFPPGAPPGASEVLSTAGFMHFTTGGLAFVGLIAACFVFARRFLGSEQRGWAIFSTLTCVAFLASWFALMATQAESAAVNVSFALAVALGWVWLSAIAAGLLQASRGG